VRVIVTSGYSQKDISPRFANQPFSAFLQKPFNSGELRLAVQQALGTPAAP
jgi:DNA-binding NtrC family response regulator